MARRIVRELDCVELVRAEPPPRRGRELALPSSQALVS
jgi:hypothetical protein